MPAAPRDEAIIAAIGDLFDPPLGLWIFGGAVEGHRRAEGDLDLAVLLPAPLEPLRRFDAAQELSLRLGCEVDLIDLATAPIPLRAEIAGRGRLLAAADARAAAEFAMLALADYARLNEERAPVLRALGVRTALGLRSAD